MTTPAVDPLLAALDRFLAAFAALDMPAFRRCFAPDATMFHPDSPETGSRARVDGRVQIARSFGPVFDAARRAVAGPPYVTVEARDVRVQRLGSAAVVTFIFDRPARSVGRRTVVFEERAGVWLIVHLHASNTA
ncbi:DUF4440 domain-containing protein [Deinococcus sp. KSM4-11]|uniref:nuclear transport factor 2 family protein n=1 Tax=Deinococcus sp. KSM4-11 TaxID=2568654 RepID=UPI0010A35DC1|nr:nuclear transport factor 2 family protein [Deinococcus sp. KSM4-11]THF84976.1 DUF4440 domain-containing protein [Deinococcus sp. KSM4-11]